MLGTIGIGVIISDWPVRQLCRKKIKYLSHLFTSLLNKISSTCGFTLKIITPKLQIKAKNTWHGFDSNRSCNHNQLHAPSDADKIIQTTHILLEMIEIDPAAGFLISDEATFLERKVQ